MLLVSRVNPIEASSVGYAKALSEVLNERFIT